MKVLWDGTYGFSSLSEKTRQSNCFQMSLQRQHFLLSYLKTLSVGPARVWTRNLPLSGRALNWDNQAAAKFSRGKYSFQFIGPLQPSRFQAVAHQLWRSLHLVIVPDRPVDASFIRTSSISLSRKHPRLRVIILHCTTTSLRSHGFATPVLLAEPLTSGFPGVIDFARVLLLSSEVFYWSGLIFCSH